MAEFWKALECVFGSEESALLFSLSKEKSETGTFVRATLKQFLCKYTEWQQGQESPWVFLVQKFRQTPLTACVKDQRLSHLVNSLRIRNVWAIGCLSSYAEEKNHVLLNKAAAETSIALESLFTKEEWETMWNNTDLATQSFVSAMVNSLGVNLCLAIFHIWRMEGNESLVQDLKGSLQQEHKSFENAKLKDRTAELSDACLLEIVTLLQCFCESRATTKAKEKAKATSKDSHLTLFANYGWADLKRETQALHAHIQQQRKLRKRYLGLTKCYLKRVSLKDQKDTRNSSNNFPQNSY